MFANATATGAYGNQVAHYFHLPHAPSLLLRDTSGTRIAVTRLSSKTALPEPTAIIPAEKAYIVPVHLFPAEHQGYETWLRGTHRRIPSWPAGAIGIYNLELNPIWRISGAFDTVHFYLPRLALEAFSQKRGLAVADSLECSQATLDPVLHQMTRMILPLLMGAERASELFLDQFRLMLCSHLVEKYGMAYGRTDTYSGGLAPWQRRRVVEVLRASLDGSLTIADLAAQCSLSASHFARSFKKSFGTSVHRYLILQRVQNAKDLMSRSILPLTEIALQSGFCDQAAFSRTFRAIVGATPGRWRREAASNCRSRGAVRAGIPAQLDADMAA